MPDGWSSQDWVVLVGSIATAVGVGAAAWIGHRRPASRPIVSMFFLFVSTYTLAFAGVHELRGTLPVLGLVIGALSSYFAWHFWERRPSETEGRLASRALARRSRERLVPEGSGQAAGRSGRGT